MDYRKLGKTGLSVSEIGLGMNYMQKQPQEIVLRVVQKAIENDVNFFDIPQHSPQFLRYLSKAFSGSREQIHLAHHLGARVKDGKYQKIRDLEEIERIFTKALAQLNTHYFDVVFLHHVDDVVDYEKIVSSDNLLELALRYQKEGKANFIGISTHRETIALNAAQSGIFDVIMLPINIGNNADPEINTMQTECIKEGVGLVAMKPFAGGKLLRKNQKVNLVSPRTGEAMEKAIPKTINAVKCISYILSQKGISTVIPGVKDLKELEATLAYLEATPKEKDFSSILKEFDVYLEGECVYCNHCLPCPADIDIGSTLRLSDLAKAGTNTQTQTEYNALPTKASDCIECGDCEERCPFHVKVIEKMKETISRLEG